MDFESLRFIKHFQIINCENEDELVADESRNQACQYAGHHCQLARGRILTYAVETERLIERICELFFFPNDQGRRERFRQMIFEAEFCSFSAKTQLLMSIAEVLELRKERPSRSLLDDLMRLRNKFAHAKIVVDWQTSNVYLRTSKGDENAAELHDTFCEKYLKAREALVTFSSAVQKKCQATGDHETDLDETNNGSL